MSMKREHPERRKPQPPASASASTTPQQSSLFIGATEASATPARTPVVASPSVMPDIVPAPPPPTAPLASSASFVPASASASGRQYLTADLRAATGLSRTAMDFYLRTEVIRPSTRTESGYLLFDEAELAVLREVIVWRTRGISLKDIKARLGREHAAERQ